MTTDTQPPAYSEMSSDEVLNLANKTLADPLSRELVSRFRHNMLSSRLLMRQVLNLLTTRYVAVVDLEATCYGPGDPQDLPNEVLEVGWALLDTQNMAVVERQQWYVKPTVSHVTPFCTELTGISAETVKNGLSYSELVHVLEKHHAEHPLGPVRTWVSYGEADPNYFNRQSQAEGVLRPWADHNYFNMKQLAGLFFGFSTKKNPGLKKAMGLAGLEMEGQHHSGTDDAFNTAKLLAYLLTEQCSAK